MLRLAADENFNNDIVRGVRRRDPQVDIVRVQDAGLSESDDPAILEWAAKNARVLLAECSLDGEWDGQVRYLPLK